MFLLFREWCFGASHDPPPFLVLRIHCLFSLCNLVNNRLGSVAKRVKNGNLKTRIDLMWPVITFGIPFLSMDECVIIGSVCLVFLVGWILCTSPSPREGVAGFA